MPGADVKVVMPSGKVLVVFMPRLLVQAQNAEFKAQHGMFLPGLAKLNPTVREIREEYEYPIEVCRTWAQAAKLLRNFYNDLKMELVHNG
jgi:hypothetical protein